MKETQGINYHTVVPEVLQRTNPRWKLHRTTPWQSIPKTRERLKLLQRQRPRCCKLPHSDARASFFLMLRTGFCGNGLIRLWDVVLMVSSEREPAEPRSMQLRSRRRSDRDRGHAIFATHNGVREPAPRRKPILPLCPSILGTFRDARRMCATSDTLLNGAYDFATDHLFMDTPLTEAAAGWILLFVSLGCLTLCLFLLVKLLQSISKGRVSIRMRVVLNLEFWIPETGSYVIILFGCAITILMQSSSVTTPTLTSLVAVGLLRLDKIFPFTVGANVGTTVTGILSQLEATSRMAGLLRSHISFSICLERSSGSPCPSLGLFQVRCQSSWVMWQLT